MREYRPETSALGSTAQQIAPQGLSSDRPKSQLRLHGPHPGDSLLQMQRAFGNRYMRRVLAHARQSERECIFPGQSLSTLAYGSVQRKCACGGDASSGGECEECRRKRETSTAFQRFAPPPAPGTMSGGRPVHPEVRARMEEGFRRDFGSVRVHEDVSGVPRPRDLGAEAFTIGHDVVIGRAMSEEACEEDQRLLAHELAHVVQQQSAPTLQSKGFASDDDPLETEADRASDDILSGRRAIVHLDAASAGGAPQAGVFSALMCAYYLWKSSGLLDQCRAEYNEKCQDLTSDDCLEWMDGAGFPSDGVMKCVGRKDPKALQQMLKWCAKTATGSYGGSKYTMVDPSDSGAMVPGLATGASEPAPAPADPSVVAQAEQTGQAPDAFAGQTTSPGDQNNQTALA